MRLRLRADIRVEAHAGGVVCTDPLLRRRLDLGAIADVLAVLDGRPSDTLTDDRQIAVIRTLLLLGMLEEAGEPVRARLRAHLAGGDLPVATLDGARFGCQGSGGCCRNYVFGPLTDADVARVQALDLSAFEAAWGADEPFYELHAAPDGTRPARFLRTRGGACVFLEGDTRCGLHARYGAASKPGFCQLFPLVAWATPSGVRVYDNGECVSFPASASGDAVADAWAAVADRVPVALQNPLVHLAPGAPCDLGMWLPVQDRLVATIRQESPDHTLRALGAALAAYTNALRRCPLTASGPVEACARVDRDWYTLPSPTGAEEGRTAIVAIAGALRAVYGAPSSGPPPPFTEAIVSALRRIERDVAGGVALPSDPKHRALWTLAFRQRMYGQRALIDGRPRPALLRACFDWLVARAAGDERLGHTIASRRLDMPWSPVHQVFTRAEGALEPVLEVLGEV